MPKYWLAQLNRSHAFHFFANDLAWRGRLMAPPTNWQPKVGRASWDKNQTYPMNHERESGYPSNACDNIVSRQSMSMCHGLSECYSEKREKMDGYLAGGDVGLIVAPAAAVVVQALVRFHVCK
jgi:hypothetical protein